jgi:hypothetical protein
MKHVIKTVEDLRWLIAHTGGFRSGYVTDVQMSKRRLFDEESGQDVLAGTTVSVTIRYQVRGLVRVAKLMLVGVTDFSIFEQEGADCSALGIIHAESSAGRFRFWFDPQGELYVVCEEAHFEEVSTPMVGSPPTPEFARWTFQGQLSNGPTVQWLLDALDHAGLPCSWRATTHPVSGHPAIQWEGDLLPSSSASGPNNMLHVTAYGAPDGKEGFGLILQVIGTRDRQICRTLEVLADHITQRYAGTCLVGTTIIPGLEWASWITQEGRTKSTEGKRS